jgi:NTE family protein
MNNSSSATPSSVAAASSAAAAASRGVTAHERALVLGGGGSTGNAWLIGIVAGLADAGVEVTDAGLTVGTSAGATTAVQLAGSSPAELYEATLVPPPEARPRAVRAADASGSAQPARSGASTARVRGRGRSEPASDYLARTNTIIATSRDAADMRRRMGAAALENSMSSDVESLARWRAIVASRLAGQDWPRRTLFISAVDADTGEPVVFDSGSGIELTDAVAASCSSAFAYRIGDRRYIDGGYRRNENADLATGFERVLILSPLGGRTRHPLGWLMQLGAQVDELRAGGSTVHTVFPEAASEHLFGANAMNLSLRPHAARAGFDQGLALADRLAGFWR